MVRDDAADMPRACLSKPPSPGQDAAMPLELTWKAVNLRTA
jgi:hypothetical protein